MKILRVVTTILIASGLVSCTVAVSPKERAALKRIYVAPVRLPAEPKVFRDPSRPILVARGPLDTLIGGYQLEPVSYMHLLQKNKIDIAAYIQTELRNQLSAKGIQSVDNPDEVDAVLRVRIDHYGISPPFASTGYVPYFSALFNLTRHNGGVIWRDWTGVGVQKKVAKEVKSYPLSDYLNDPQLLDRQIRNVNRVVISFMLDTL